MKIPVALQHLLRPVPIWAVQRAAQSAYERVIGRHRGMFGRLGEYADKTFVFAPTDIPFEFAVRPADNRISVARPGRNPRYDAHISGPIFLLLALAEGRVDGDAEFFGRALAIDGDMEAVLALRNALEDTRIDFSEDLAPRNGPLRRPVAAGLRAARNVALARRSTRWN